MKNKRFIVSAVVPVYNSGDYIEETIYSLLKQKRKFDEIIVVDDGSTDNTLRILKKIKGIKVIKAHHRERSAARNLGWKKSKGNIIAFIESDSVFDQNWLKEVIKGFEAGYDTVIDKRYIYKPNTFISKMNDHFYDLRYKNYKPFSAWTFSRKSLEKIGGFDENLMGPEDVDLGKRILDKGYKIYFAENAVQYHKGEPKNIIETVKRGFFYGCRIIPYWKKTGSIPYIKFIAFTIIIFSAIFKSSLFITLALIYLIYVFIRDLLRGMESKYLLVHPLYMFLSEICFTIGAWYGILGGSVKKLR